MLFAFKNRDDLEKLEELALIKDQVDELRLKDKVGKRICNEKKSN